MKVLVRASLHSSNEVGYDSFELIRALLRAGFTVYLDPVDVEAPLPQDIATLLVQPHPNDYDLAIDYGPLNNVGVTPKLLDRAEYAVAWVYHDSEVSHKHGLRKQLMAYDIVVAQDETTFYALEPYTQEFKQEPGIIRILQPSGYDSDVWRPVNRDWFSEEFEFLVVSRGENRENVEGTIEAFNQLRQENPNVHLTIKTVPEDTLNDQLMTAVPGLIIHKASWDRDVYRSFFKMMHAIVCVDTGGYKNLHAIQFLATGGTAIATNWSLNRNWLTSAHSYPIKYSPASVRKGGRNELVTLPDTYDIYTAMKECVDNRVKAEQKGRIASDVLPVALGWTQILDYLFMRMAAADAGADNLRNKFLRVRPQIEEEGPWKM